MDDLISRQAAIDALAEWHDAAITNRLNNLPSAQPTDADVQKMQDIEQAMLEKAYWFGRQDAMQWIPCSERLPEYGATVLTYNNDDEYEINHLIDKDDVEWFFNGAVAWMPLPEPWKGEQE